jgi:hypothetical protein
MGITTKNILDGDTSAFIAHTAFFMNLIKRFLKNWDVLYYFFQIITFVIILKQLFASGTVNIAE